MLLPSAEEFRVLMGFPKEGDAIGELRVKSESVQRLSATSGKTSEAVFSAEMVVEGAGSESEVKAALERLFQNGKLIFSENGTPYLCDVRKIAVRQIGDKFVSTSMWICMVQPRRAKLRGVRSNLQVAGMLREIAELYKLKDEIFRSRAFFRAAQQVESLTIDVAKIYESGGLERIPGIGRGIAGTIGEYLTTERSSLLEKLRSELPAETLELMTIEGIGPKTAARLNRELGVTSVEQLETALRAGEVRSLPGFGPKTEENLLRILAEKTRDEKRRLLGSILPIVREIEDYLTNLDEEITVSVAGSTRRMKETIGDIDFLAASLDAEKTVEHFTSMPGIVRVVSKGTSRSTVIVEGNLQIDLRVVQPGSYGAALQYFTGSKGHNIKLRSLALQQGCKLNEYGLFRRASGERLAGETEESIYQALELQFIEPELREDRGEIEAALEGHLPRITEYGEIKGDLHVHSNWSDGAGSLKEIAEAAQTRQLEYVAICDHSKALGIARGLNEERVRKQMHEIERLNRTFEGFRLLQGIEVDVMSDGALDLPNGLLRDLDIVVASLHRGFRSAEEKLTARILSAIHNDHVTTIGHPTGRILPKRAPYPLNLPEVFRAAADQHVMMEINAFPDRLDLNDVHSRLAKTHGVRLAIGTDAHTPAQMSYLELGVSVARRAWLEAHDVVNNLNAKDLLQQVVRA